MESTEVPTGTGWITKPASTKKEIDDFLLQWIQKLLLLGIHCKGLAINGLGEDLDKSFPDELENVNKEWFAVAAQGAPSSPLMQIRTGEDLLVCLWIPMSGIQNKDRQGALAGVLIGPPYSNKTLLIIQLAAASLQLLLVSEASKHAQRAVDALELLVSIGTKRTSRVAAQEWINRTAAWARSLDLRYTDLSLTLYQVRSNTLVWWVSSESSWEEASSDVQHAATNVANEALLRDTIIQREGWVAIPCHTSNQMCAIAVVKTNLALELPVSNLIIASARVCLPYLEQWRKADQSLWQSVWDALTYLLRDLRTAGNWSKKFVSAVSVASIFVVTLIPVEDRVTAPLVIEGLLRMTVTAPQDGFLSKVYHRPGDRVKQGDLLASLDRKELSVERDRLVALRDQAESKLRQAMAEHEAVGFQAASAELRSSQAHLQLIESKLSRIDLLAPVSGLVVSGDWAHQIGVPLSVGKEMFEVAADPGLRAAMHVPDLDIARVRAGQSGVLKLAGQPDQTYQFTVSKITSVATVHDGVNGFRVEASWSGEAPSLSPGMQGVGKVVVGETNLITKWFRPMMNWVRLKVWSIW